MATQYANGKIVTAGLVLALDAADRNSYVSGSTTWNDVSGNGNSGTLTNGPAFSNNSIVFDGVDDRVSRNQALNTGQNFTINAWIYPTLLGTTRRAIAASSYNYSSRNGWLFSTAGGGTNNTFFLSIGADATGIGAPANTLNTNQWSYITATCQNGGENIVLYKNGQVVVNFNGLSGPISYTHPQFNIGFRDVGGTTDPFTGNISQIQIYNRALSASEVLQNYNAQKSRFNL